MVVRFSVLGEPCGKGRPKFARIENKVTTRTPEKTVMYENLVKTEYRRQCGSIAFPDDAMLAIQICAYYSIPKSASKIKMKRMLSGEQRPIKRPDYDNIGKIVCDALNRIAYRDDAQIVDGIVRKYYSEKPRIEVTIKNIG